MPVERLGRSTVSNLPKTDPGVKNGDHDVEECVCGRCKAIDQFDVQHSGQKCIAYDAKLVVPAPEVRPAISISRIPAGVCCNSESARQSEQTIIYKLWTLRNAGLIADGIGVRFNRAVGSSASSQQKIKRAILPRAPHP